MNRVLILAQQGPVNLDPDPQKFPGSEVLQSLTNGIAGLALIVCLLALVAGAGIWAFGANSSNVNQTLIGKRAVLISGVAALAIGAAPFIINFMFGAGSQVR